ncbi:MAG: zinc-binding dehydrogenase, partial [Propionibacteriaceae bacterium]|nr:zinc-binding dehydrogenase [Propionibacteriaceae bacterium]
MLAVKVIAPGGPEQLAVAEVPTPVAGPGEILVKVAAAGVNRADVLQRRGFYPPPPGASELLGLEVSGTVAELGKGVGKFNVGDPCVALLAGGGYAEYVSAPAGQVIAPPPGASMETAAGVVEVAATVVSNFAVLGLSDFHPSLTVLVHGGSGGVGSFAVQYAKARGCRVIATAGTPEKLELCRKLGADLAIDYHEDWVAQVKAEGGADLILDVMGAKYLDSNV